MLVNEFRDTYQLYDGFMVWEIDSIKSFFDGNGILPHIFEDVYNMPYSEFAERRGEIADTDMEIMTNLLHLVDNKSFLIFTLHDRAHLDLIALQQMKVMNFGMDINNIKEDHVYVMIMDKKGAEMN